MWDCKGLVQIEMDDVNPIITWLCNAKQCIHICAISINKGSMLVHYFGNLKDILLK